MKHNIPIPFYFEGSTIDEAINNYKDNVPAILDELFEAEGKEHKVMHFATLYNSNKNHYTIIISVMEDELKAEREKMMSMAKKALGEAGLSGDPNCDHAFEDTPEGLVCSKCGGKLG